MVVGAGGLGSPAAFYLAAAGIGRLGIVDDDNVDLSNLQRQILHRTQDIGKPKVLSAERALTELNPGVKVEAHQIRLNSTNVAELIRNYDVILNGVDNFPTRYLLNDACVMEKKPLVEAGILRWDGLLMTIKPGEGPCYRCIFPEPPPPGVIPTCQEAGVIGAIAGIMGTIQALEAIKVILGKGETLTGRMLVFDALETRFREVKARRDENCPVCGANPTITELTDWEVVCGIQDGGAMGVGTAARDATP